jgi:preprotein translocase SecF subunit
MIQILHGTKIPFMNYRLPAYVLSAALVLATLGYLAVKGPRYSVDFTGGTLLQVRIAPAATADAVRDAVEAGGFAGAEIQQMTGDAKDEFLIRVKNDTTDVRVIATRLTRAISTHLEGAQVEQRRVETVGPKVGKELRQKALWAIVASLSSILLYVGWRYEFKFALGGVVAILHDVLVTLGFVLFTGREVSLTVIAALLTIAGFSINDTIVTFDRIRERSKSHRKESHREAMDIAVNETLSRTVITALTVFFCTLALYVWGGEVLNDFSFAMLIGVVVGTYSTVFIASAMALDIWTALDRRKHAQAK